MKLGEVVVLMFTTTSQSYIKIDEKQKSFIDSQFNEWYVLVWSKKPIFSDQTSHYTISREAAAERLKHQIQHLCTDILKPKKVKINFKKHFDFRLWETISNP